MALSEPKPGLVITYAYLWDAEARAGREEGLKDRPCVIVIVDARRIGDDIIVTVAPITHNAPRQPDEAIELPTQTKARLGLDNQRSWVVTTELNRFVWPGPDVRPSSFGKVAPQFLPGSLMETLRAQILRRARVSLVQRTS